jgi:hypothetical protein
MNKLDTKNKLGGWDFVWDDTDFIQEAYREALEGIGSTVGNCILSGVELQNNNTISSGFVFYNGEVLYVPSTHLSAGKVNLNDFYFEVEESSDSAGTRYTQSGLTINVFTVRQGKITGDVGTTVAIDAIPLTDLERYEVKLADLIRPRIVTPVTRYDFNSGKYLVGTREEGYSRDLDYSDLFDAAKYGDIPTYSEIGSSSSSPSRSTESRSSDPELSVGDPDPGLPTHISQVWALDEGYAIRNSQNVVNIVGKLTIKDSFVSYDNNKYIRTLPVGYRPFASTTCTLLSAEDGTVLNMSVSSLGVIESDIIPTNKTYYVNMTYLAEN